MESCSIYPTIKRVIIIRGYKSRYDSTYIYAALSRISLYQ